jgi:hypothetical protein
MKALKGNMLDVANQDQDAMEPEDKAPSQDDKISQVESDN